ncbi:homoprotocatechuate degradation operon regulator HpaR [Albidovulum sediminis]|uniref:Homoprotocatechuate degradation operon regulator HpaR n=1 Tax=Albidovulum sediminis TaxID=3066345 RepID=A0ABT2NQH5_9RHOB|nr:homoprotocatechuate degradation operon regulator HpaR [Defluviimonas sediminis]MCT8331188.1 homoprotocatechuate degradation operon regulator HpaR [Defluviimonas sediminis]
MTNDRSFLRTTRRSLPIALLRARETLMAPIREMLGESGVNEQKWRVLRVLHELGPLELGQLATEACLLQSSLTRMVKPLEGEGLVTRHTPPEDRRKTVLAITEAGVALILRHSARSADIFARIEAEFGAERVELLLNLLDDLQRLDLRKGGAEP